MGQKITSPDIEHGNDCNRCTGAPFFRWPAGGTPEYIWVSFSGLVNCGFSHHPAPNGKLFRLTQSNINHCLWVLVGSVWFIEFQSHQIIPALSKIRLLDHTGWSFFVSQGPPCPFEYWRFPNNQAACVLMYAGSAGWATVWWGDGILDMVEWFGLSPGSSLFYDVSFSAPAFEYHRFADREQRTNVKFKKI